LTRLSKHALSLIVLAGLLVPSAVAGNKESPHDLLARSFQQANLWTGGPVKLTVNVRLPKQDGSGDITLVYTVSWAGPEKWRAEWTAGGLEQVAILNNNKLSYSSNQAAPLIPLIEIESALAALDGGNPAGPYMVPPLDWDKAKIDNSKKKVGSIDAKCMALGDPLQTFCIDPGTAQLLTMGISVNGAEVGSFEYGNYTTISSNTYPQSVKVNYATKLLDEGKMTVSRSEKFEESLFAAPEKSTTFDWPSCADVSKNYSAPEVKKAVPAKMSDAARKAKKYGLVWILATVNKDGSVTKAISIGGDPDLNQAAIDAVQQYKFSPYTRCGLPAEYQKVVPVPFAPPQRPGDTPMPSSH
jgi:TonB family protein